MIAIRHFNGMSWATIREYSSTAFGRRAAGDAMASFAKQWMRDHGTGNVRIGSGYFEAPGCIYEITNAPDAPTKGA